MPQQLTGAEASLPLGWHVAGVWRFADTWIALGEGSALDAYLSGAGRIPELHHADRRGQSRPSSRLRSAVVSEEPHGATRWRL